MKKFVKYSLYGLIYVIEEKYYNDGPLKDC